MEIKSKSAENYKNKWILEGGVELRPIPSSKCLPVMHQSAPYSNIMPNKIYFVQNFLPSERDFKQC